MSRTVDEHDFLHRTYYDLENVEFRVGFAMQVFKPMRDRETDLAILRGLNLNLEPDHGALVNLSPPSRP